MRLVQNISISPEGIDVAYMGETDVRGDGGVYQTHRISVSRDHEGMSDEIREFEEAVEHFLEQAIRAWATTLPVDLVANARQQMDLDDDDNDDDEQR